MRAYCNDLIEDRVGQCFTSRIATSEYDMLLLDVDRWAVQLLFDLC